MVWWGGIDGCDGRFEKADLYLGGGQVMAEVNEKVHQYGPVGARDGVLLRGENYLVWSGW